MRFLLLMIAAIVVVFLGASAVRHLTGGKDSAPESSIALPGQPPKDKPRDATPVEVLVARQFIPLGAVIDDSMVDKQSWPGNLVPSGFIISGTPEASGLNGRIARSPFTSREPLNVSRLGNAGDPNFLAGVLPAGSYAITMTLNPDAAMAGHLFPGDQVDVLLTSKDKKARGKSEKLVEGLMVLGVAPDPSEANAATMPSSVTLEVPQEAAQKLRASESQGLLSLALRSSKINGATDAAQPVVLQGGTQP